MRVVVLKKSDDNSSTQQSPGASNMPDTSQDSRQHTAATPWGQRLNVTHGNNQQNGLPPPIGKRHSVANAYNPSDASSVTINSNVKPDIGASAQVSHLPPRGRAFGRRGSYCGISQQQQQQQPPASTGLCFGQDYTKKEPPKTAGAPSFGHDYNSRVRTSSHPPSVTYGQDYTKKPSASPTVGVSSLEVVQKPTDSVNGHSDNVDSRFSSYNGTVHSNGSVNARGTGGNKYDLKCMVTEPEVNGFLCEDNVSSKDKKNSYLGANNNSYTASPTYRENSP